MSEREKEILDKLAEKLPHMSERERGYLEGTINTAAAMSEKQKENKQLKEETLDYKEISEPTKALAELISARAALEVN